MTPDTTNYPKICEHRKEWEIFMTDCKLSMGIFY